MNQRKNYAAYLAESLSELEAARGHLEYSAKSCQALIPSGEPYSEDALIQIEAFTSRFARVVDLLTKRVLRAIDQYEMLDPGTLLDVANRAEKRGLVHSVDWLRDLKETRNQIAHDYSGERLTEVLSYCLTELSQLLEACTRTSSYGKKIQTEES